MCHIPLSYFLIAIVGEATGDMKPEDDGGANPTGRGAPLRGSSASAVAANGGVGSKETV